MVSYFTVFLGTADVTDVLLQEKPASNQKWVHSSPALQLTLFHRRASKHCIGLQASKQDAHFLETHLLAHYVGVFLKHQ